MSVGVTCFFFEWMRQIVSLYFTYYNIFMGSVASPLLHYVKKSRRESKGVGRKTQSGEKIRAEIRKSDFFRKRV